MKHLALSHVSVLALSFCAPAVAMAQGAPNTPESSGAQSATIEEVVVTAQKRAENLQDVPLAITVNSAQELADAGVSTTAELGFVTPGLNFASGGGAFAVPRLRGIGAGQAIGGNESPVSTYVDGVYISSPSASILSFNNIEQVAVLKGPQGTLFGRNATGGLIQVTTRTPSQDFTADASVTYGNLDTVGGQLYLSGGLADSVAADLAVYYNDQREGFGRNLFNGHDANRSEDVSVRSKWKFDFSEATSLTLIADHSEKKADQPGIRPVIGTIPITGVPFAGGEFDINSEYDPKIRSRQQGLSGTLTHEFGSLEFQSITAYREGKTRATFDLDRLPVFLAPILDVHQTDEQFTQEFQVSNSGEGSPLQWVAGLYYFDAISHTDPSRIRTPAVIVDTDAEQDAESIAGYVQASYKITPKAQLTAGLRYTTEKRELDVFTRTSTLTGITLATGPRLVDDERFNKLTWRLALDYHFTDDVLGYVSYNRGFKSGGYNATSPPNPLVPFLAEVLDAYETGLKADLLDRRLRLNGSTFYYDYKNIQVTALNNGVTNIYNAASAELYGIDADITAVPIESLTLQLGLSIIHHRFDDFPGAIIASPAVPNGTTIRGGNVLGTGNAKGNRLPMTPDWTVNLGATYKIPLPTGNIELSGLYYHNDGYYGEPDNFLQQSSYDIVNGSITWNSDEDNGFRVSLWGRNLTNEAYAQQFTAQALSSSVTVGPGRTYGVTVGVSF